MKPQQQRPLPTPREPRAPARPTHASWHGVTLTDEYAWLKDDNWQVVIRDPAALKDDIRAYLEAENDYTAALLGDTDDLQAALFAEMRGRIKEDDSSVPTPDGPFAYFTRFREGAQHPMICRTPRDGGPEEVLLDGDALAHGKAFFHLGEARQSPDHKFIAWLCDEAGSEFYTARIRNIETGLDLADIVPEATGSAVWSADGSAIYYVRLDENHRPHSVHRHRLGTQVSEDELIFENDDPQYFVSISQTQSGRFGRITLHDHETSECWLLDLDDPHARPRLVARRETGVQYDVEDHPTLGGEPMLVIRTNADGAEDFKIALAPLANSERGNWRDLVPHRPGVYLLTFMLLADWLIRLEREDGVPRIVVRRLGTGEEHTIAFAEEAYSLGVDPGFEFATNTLRFTYASMTTPSEVWDYDLVTRERVLRKRQEIPSGHDPSSYVTRRLMAPGHDGAMIPISLLHHKDTPIDGSAPGLLYGYGAYGISIPAGFSGSRLSLVERGFVYAIAHVRGGTEKGWHWYRNGKLAHKPNTFRDFISAAEFLTANGWMARDKVVADGGSAGGMLMGVIANERPDLWAGVIAEVPFVDVLNTMLDGSLPLTPPEWPEWGDPRTDEAAFKLIRSYSPYDNVRAQAYPAMLVLAGLTDPRVTYWEPAKWVARLRARRTNDALLALRTNLDAGHGGASGRFERLKEVALSYAFAIKVTGARRAMAAGPSRA
ncbi:MAG TPA: S9 family peptidase [Xanthobacteraceae bacterium]|nr:S9 family peptidase [Xanthobacteraceae bacterium]